MTTYITYKCSVCRRQKDIEEDTLRALPNKCTITKGCSGILLKIGKKNRGEEVEAVAGVEDWYPRGTKKYTTATVEPIETANLATSNGGAFVVAIREGEFDPPDFLDLVLLQRRTEAVAYQEFAYKATTNQTVFSGKDLNGKILRFDSTAISENRVLVYLNGVPTLDVTLTTNNVEFTDGVQAGSSVRIRVQAEKEAIERTLRVTRNSLQNPVLSRGSWANVDYVDRFEEGPYKHWTLYSADILSGIGVGKIKIVDTDINGPMMILMAHSPYENADRYYDLVVDVDPLKEDFLLSLESADSNSLVVNRGAMVELYPPLIIPTAAFITPDTVETEASSAVVSDDDTIVLLKNSKIIGPT
jgi:hypothetical protein